MVVISEEDFKTSSWYDEILSGLRAQSRKKRVPIEMYDKNSDIPSGEGCALIIGSTYKWLSDVIFDVLQLGYHPIVLANQPYHAFNGKYSTVSIDIPLSMDYVIRMYKGNGKKRIAFYGANSGSLSDISKIKSFIESQGNENIFYNNNSLQNCFNDFWEQNSKEKYDAIICANDYAAVSLVHNLRENVKDYSIISYSNTILSSCCKPSITSINLNYKAFGEAALIIAETMQKKDNLTGMSISVDWKIVFRETSAQLIPEKKEKIERNLEQDNFYDDNNTKEMLMLEKMLIECDETDKQILKSLKRGMSLYKASEECFITENTLKYRMKKIRTNCGVNSKGELMDLLDKYNIDVNRI